MSGICYAITKKPTPTQVAPNPNTAQGVPSLRMVIITSTLWRPSQLLQVRFAEGSDQQKMSVANWASEWGKHANLFFTFGSTDEKAEIVVKFGPVGNWSGLGTEILNRNVDYFVRYGCTMNIQDLDQSTVQHEFGHAIGCQHEHESPAGGIQWNKEAVYRELGGDPNFWDKGTVDWNMFTAFDKNLTQFTALDRTSIMMYEIPARWTTDGFSTTRQGSLSATDKAFIGAMYPGATALFDKADIRTAHCTVTSGPGTMYNQAYGNSWIMHVPGASFIEVNFDQARKFGGRNIYTQANLRLNHLSSAGGDGYQSPIDIVVNGTKIKDNYSPASDNWIEDNFDITAQMKDGANKIRLEFQAGAQMNYWINKLKVVCSGGESLKFN